MTGGTYAGLPEPYETTYPQDVRNCAKCHRAPAPLADHWKTQPSSRACGACHDDRSFEATPPPGRDRAHAAGRRRPTSAAAPATRRAASAATSPAKHVPVSAPNPAQHLRRATDRQRQHQRRLRRGGGRRPGGRQGGRATSSQSVSTWTDAAAGNVLRPQIAFKFKLDGADVVFPNPAPASELIPGFVGSPSAYFVFAVPQDGKAAPADFNASASAYIKQHLERHRHLLERRRAPPPAPGAGTLTGPDARASTRSGSPARRSPPNATMLTGGIGYTYGARIAAEPAPTRISTSSTTRSRSRRSNLAAYPYVAEQEGGRRHAGLRRRGRADRPAARRVEGRHRVHRPARHRRQQQVRRVPRVAGRRARLPCRPAQRRRHLQLVSPPQPDQQRLVGQREGLRPRHPRRREAHDAVHLAPGVAHRGLLEDDLPRRAQQVRDVPPARDLRLQRQRHDGRLPQHARQHRGSGDLRGRQRACALRGRGDRLRRRLQLQRAHRARP